MLAVIRFMFEAYTLTKARNYGKIKKCVKEKGASVLINSLQLTWKKYEWVWIVIIACLTAISSEIKLVPFEQIDFRFGLGSIIFLLLLLIRPTEHIIRTGLVTGLVVVLFRMGMESAFRQTPVTEAFLRSAPTFMFYSVYACSYKWLKVDRLKSNAIQLGIIATFIEIIANAAEHLARFSITQIPIGLDGWLLVIGVACFRSFFVVGIYVSIAQAYQQRELTKNLTVNANIYSEKLYLTKLMRQTEEVMAHSYQLYRTLKKEEHPAYYSALHIAQEIHEVKKDSQRIYASVEDIAEEFTQPIQLSQLLYHVRVSNEAYARYLGKSCTISITQHGEMLIYQSAALLTILNNLVANAIEAMTIGKVQVTVTVANEVIISVQDDGEGIQQVDEALIFEPGFTTKYNQQGVAATGIGLSHVRDSVASLGGEITLVHQVQGTCFIVTLPKIQLEE